MTYRTSFEKKPTLRETVKRLGRRERIVREIEALKGVSFEVEHGKVLGIVHSSCHVTGRPVKMCTGT